MAANERDVNADAWGGEEDKNNPHSTKREAQERSRGRDSQGQAESPVDSKHVDAPKERDNRHGHREGNQRKEG